MTTIQNALFDYASLDTHTRAFVQEKAQHIHARLKRTAEDIIAIGQDLIEVKACLEHGQFENWLQSEFDMREQTARNFMNVSRKFGSKTPNFGHLPLSVLYELAAPSIPQTSAISACTQHAQEKKCSIPSLCLRLFLCTGYCTRVTQEEEGEC